MWLALAFGLMLTALFATGLQAVGVSNDTSLLLAVLLLIALILFGMSKAPWSFLQGKEGIPWERFFRIREIARADAFDFYDRYTLRVIYFLLIIKRSGEDVYFWKVTGEEEPRRRRGRWCRRQEEIEQEETGDSELD